MNVCGKASNVRQFLSNVFRKRINRCRKPSNGFRGPIHGWGKRIYRCGQASNRCGKAINGCPKASNLCARAIDVCTQAAKSCKESSAWEKGRKKPERRLAWQTALLPHLRDERVPNPVSGKTLLSSFSQSPTLPQCSTPVLVFAAGSQGSSC